MSSTTHVSSASSESKWNAVTSYGDVRLASGVWRFSKIGALFLMSCRAGPGVDRLLVVAHGEHVAVLARERVDDSVLDGVQVLELIHEDGAPALADLARGRRLLEQLGGLHDEGVEVDDVPLRQKLLVLREEPRVVGVELIAAQPVDGEAREDLAVRLLRADEPTEHGALILFVGDPEAGAEVDVRTVFAEQLRAERVERASLHALGP